MGDLTVTESQFDFSASHEVLDRYVDKELIAGANAAVLKGQDILDLYATGKADISGDIDMGVDHIFRAYSNTKIMTAIAVMMLYEEGKLKLDDPVETWIPQLGNRKVFKADAKDMGDVEDAERSITVRHLLTHSSGLSYGVFDPGTLIFDAYAKAGVGDVSQPLSGMMDALEGIPLGYQPGTSWNYSVATDVLGYLVQVINDRPFDEVLKERIWDPLEMVDTGFVLPAEKASRLAKVYLGADLGQPMLSGLTESPGLMAFDYSKRPVRPSGGGGTVSTLPDMIKLMRSFLPGGTDLLKRETRDLMMQNHLPEGQNISFAGVGEVPGLGHGLGAGVKLVAWPGEPDSVVGEYHWGGVAGTHWWINMELGVAGLNMAQREMGFWHPFSAEHKAAIYAGLGV